MESVFIQSFSGPYFPTFRTNTERYGLSLQIQSECGKIWTRKTPNRDTSHPMIVLDNLLEVFGCFIITDFV